MIIFLDVITKTFDTSNETGKIESLLKSILHFLILITPLIAIFRPFPNAFLLLSIFVDIFAHLQKRCAEAEQENAVLSAGQRTGHSKDGFVHKLIHATAKLYNNQQYR